ncbi:2-dehydropantoate 2-reductase N-terminal domain-containing protein [uncultured Nocardioides sp.]|uniref:ketopantoate reductase family protein n=1 Tax=uncultured Nocardioides sp. TaxID=198441 RepID=UPI0026214B94|nr:2-dehydropantoate 2-reductase N-terminal domain-containing protein [uncultured Nocardioides sp.]
MRYVVLGAGAVGGVVGGLLARAGTDVTLVARGPHLDAVRRDGLLVVRGDEEWRVDVPAVPDASEAGLDAAGTVLVLAVKSQHTAAALEPLLPLPVDLPVVCLQNGVANERLLLRHSARVHGVCVMLPCAHLEPGTVRLFSLGRPGILDVGRAAGGVDQVDRAVAGDLVGAGFLSEPRGDVMAWKHRKLLMNLGNGVDAACGDGEAAAELVARCRAEGEEVLAAAGVAVTSAEDDRARRAEHLRPLARDDGVGSSTWQSLQRAGGAGGTTEADHLNGEIVLRARLLGRRAPYNEVVQRAVAELARAGGRPRSLDAAGLLSTAESARLRT